MQLCVSFLLVLPVTTERFVHPVRKLIKIPISDIVLGQVTDYNMDQILHKRKVAAWKKYVSCVHLLTRGGKTSQYGFECVDHQIEYEKLFKTRFQEKSLYRAGFLQHQKHVIPLFYKYEWFPTLKTYEITKYYYTKLLKKRNKTNKKQQTKNNEEVQEEESIYFTDVRTCFATLEVVPKEPSRRRESDSSVDSDEAHNTNDEKDEKEMNKMKQKTDKTHLTKKKTKKAKSDEYYMAPQDPNIPNVQLAGAKYWEKYNTDNKKWKEDENLTEREKIHLLINLSQRSIQMTDFDHDLLARSDGISGNSNIWLKSSLGKQPPVMMLYINKPNVRELNEENQTDVFDGIEKKYWINTLFFMSKYAVLIDNELNVTSSVTKAAISVYLDVYRSLTKFVAYDKKYVERWLIKYAGAKYIMQNMKWTNHLKRSYSRLLENHTKVVPLLKRDWAELGLLKQTELLKWVQTVWKKESAIPEKDRNTPFLQHLVNVGLKYLFTNQTLGSKHVWIKNEHNVGVELIKKLWCLDSSWRPTSQMRTVTGKKRSITESNSTDTMGQDNSQTTKGEKSLKLKSNNSAQEDEDIRKATLMSLESFVQECFDNDDFEASWGRIIAMKKTIEEYRQKNKTKSSDETTTDNPNK